MSRLLLLASLFFVWSCKNQKITESRKTQSINTLLTIAFGSCNHSNDPQDIWPSIMNYNPDYWVWLGDIIYADTEDMGVMKDMYDEQKNATEYQAFIREVPTVYGIWDDHDYGVNDGNKLYPKKEESKKLLLDFLDVDSNHAVWSHEGVYQSYRLDENINLILLDGRTFCDPQESDENSEQRYKINETGDILGEAQWMWLENKIQSLTNELVIIGSGIQIVSEQHNFEKWANFPKSHQRLYELFAKYPSNKYVIISGDRHRGEISKISIPNLPTDVYDITASGMTHSYPLNVPEINKHRVGGLYMYEHFGLLTIAQTDSTFSLTGQIIDEKGTIQESVSWTY